MLNKIRDIVTAITIGSITTTVSSLALVIIFSPEKNDHWPLTLGAAIGVFTVIGYVGNEITKSIRDQEADGVQS